METVKLKAATKDYIWGGNYLKNWGIESDMPTIAEAWVLSFNPSGPSVIASGNDKGKLLMDVATKEDIGLLPASFPFFPVLIKFINSASNLSVQVHPSDEYALKKENQFGKTEMWYVLEAKEGAGLYVGFEKEVTKEQLLQGIKDGNIMNLLHFIPVKAGDSYFIPSGTVHAIGAGVTLIEIQQNSTLTYRLYDYHRKDKNGKERELHVEKALEVLSLKPYQKIDFKKPIIGSCKYFTSQFGEVKNEADFHARVDSFMSISFLSGEGEVDHIPFHRGDTFFIPANKKAHIEGNGKYILTEVK